MFFNSLSGENYSVYIPECGSVLADADHWNIPEEEVSNGKVSIKMAGKQKFDLIIMDVRMPVIDGFEATRRIKARMRPAGRMTREQPACQNHVESVRPCM